MDIKVAWLGHALVRWDTGRTEDNFNDFVPGQGVWLELMFTATGGCTI